MSSAPARKPNKSRYIQAAHLKASDVRLKATHSSDLTVLQRQIGGPGIWATCPRGREGRAVGELYALLERVRRPCPRRADHVQ